LLLINSVKGIVLGRIVILANFFVLTNYAFFARPVQDDYVTLKLLTQGNVLNPSQDLIQNWGGNITSVVIRSILLFPSRNTDSFIGLSLFVFLTFGLLVLTIYSYVVLVHGLSPTLFEVLAFSSLVSLCLEGLFSPTSLGIYSFSAASIVHFWPVCFFVIAIFLISRNLYLFASFFIFLGANCNITEGFFAVTILIILFVLNIADRKRLAFPISASILALLFTALAPGFSKRNNQFQSSHTLSDLLWEFLQNLGKVCVDLISHPGGILMLLLGMLLAHLGIVRANISLISLIGSFFVIYLIGTSLGASIAYLAWHQTLGLLLVWFALLFEMGASCKIIKISSMRSVLNFIGLPLIAFLLLLNVRPVLEIANRSASWDSNYRVSICDQSDVEFKSAEIVYPPLHLGIEDISDWPWMKEAYNDWVEKNRVESGYCD
jgi:hypothetical protein